MDGWSWTTTIERVDIDALDGLATIQPLRALRGLGHAYVVPAPGMKAVVGSTSFAAFDAATFQIDAPAGQRIAGGPERDARWILARERSTSLPWSSCQARRS